jgi:hypothetical protein
MKEITTITTKREHEIKPLRHCELTEAEKKEERELVKEAEKRVYKQWSFGPWELSINSAEAKAWRSNPKSEVAGASPMRGRDAVVPRAVATR